MPASKHAPSRRSRIPECLLCAQRPRSKAHAHGRRISPWLLPCHPAVFVHFARETYVDCITARSGEGPGWWAPSRRPLRADAGYRKAQVHSRVRVGQTPVSRGIASQGGNLADGNPKSCRWTHGGQSKFAKILDGTRRRLSILRPDRPVISHMIVNVAYGIRKRRDPAGPLPCVSLYVRRNYMRCGAEMPRIASVCANTTRVASHKARRAFFSSSLSAFKILQLV